MKFDALWTRASETRWEDSRMGRLTLRRPAAKARQRSGDLPIDRSRERLCRFSNRRHARKGLGKERSTGSDASTSVARLARRAGRKVENIAAAVIDGRADGWPIGLRRREPTAKTFRKHFVSSQSKQGRRSCSSLKFDALWTRASETRWEGSPRMGRLTLRRPAAKARQRCGDLAMDKSGERLCRFSNRRHARKGLGNALATEPGAGTLAALLARRAGGDAANA